MPSIIGVDVWRGVGYLMVILIAGIQAIPKDYFEAAAIDGASGLAAFRYIMLPMLMPVLAVTTVLNLLYTLKVFDVVFVLTNGGPGREPIPSTPPSSTSSPKADTAWPPPCQRFSSLLL